MEVWTRLWAGLCATASAAAAFTLMLGPAHALDQFQVVAPGAEKDMVTALENASLVKQAQDSEITDPVELIASARADYARYVGVLYARGFYGGVVSIKVDGREAADISPINPPDRVSRIVAEVRTGPAYKFERADIGPLAFETALPEGFAVGETARSNLIQQSVSTAVRAWRDDGHAKAALAGQNVVADHRARTLSADVDLEPGPKLRFGELKVESTSTVSDRRIRQIAGLPTGEVFSPEELNRAGRRLRDTGTFSSAAMIEAETPNPDGTLDITAQIVDQKRRRFGFGAEYATDEGATVNGFWMHRNLFNDAMRLRIDGEISGIAGQTDESDFTLTFALTRPATFGARTDAFFIGEAEALNRRTFESTTVTLAFGARRRQTDDLTLSLALLYLYSDELDDAGEVEYSQLYFPFRAIWEKRNDILDATEGFYINTQLAPFVGFGGSDNGALFEFDGRYYLGFGASDRIVAAARLQVGSILGTDVTGVPNDYRFYSGGSGTVRGQEYESLGVTLPNGAESGGSSFLGIQSEIRAKVTDAISVVGFFDWGAIGADSLPGDAGDDHAGAGIGVRYDTGIGPIRVDIGFPIGGKTGENANDFQLYIGIGQAF